MPYLTVRNVRFHVQELGIDKPGPTIVMVHGLFVGTLASWYFSAAPALAQHRRVFLYDLRGHGRTERPASGYTVESMAMDLAALTHTLGPISLIGHSFGALVCLRYTMDHPGRVQRLAIVEAPLPPSKFREIDEFAQRTPAEMLSTLPAALRDALAGGGRRASRLVSSLQALSSDTSLLHDLAREPDMPDAMLGKLDCPVLCIYGANSSCREVGDRLLRVLPNARLEVLAGGHFLPFEAAQPLAHQLEEFFCA